jgi:hypothetical protein
MIAALERAGKGEAIRLSWAPTGIPMRRPPRAALLLTIALVLSVAGRLSSQPVLLVVPPDLEAAWSAVTGGTPLPEGVEIRRAAVTAPGTAAQRPGSGGEGLIVMARRRAGARLPEAGPGVSWKVVDRGFLAPHLPLGDARTSVPEAEALSGAVPVAPLEKIVLPRVAVAAGGKYPGDAGYPLEEDVLLGVRAGDDRVTRWFDSVPEKPEARLLWVGAVGDIMPARGVDAVLLQGEPGARRVFGGTLEVLRGFGFLIGNLEAAATRGGRRAVKSYTFRFQPEALDFLKKAGFTYLSITNNHSFDFGPEGFLDTLDALSERGIGTSGAGKDLAEASRPFVETSGQVELRVLSYGDYPPEAGGFDGEKVAAARADRPGILWLDEGGVAAAARGFRAGSFNIAIVHGGREWEARPTGDQRRFYRALVEAGADLVIGSHPHVLQGMEAWKGALIAYSLGNFLFPGMDGTPGGEESVILEAGLFDGKLRYVVPVGARLSGGTVRRDAGGRSVGVLLSRTRDLAASGVRD